MKQFSLKFLPFLLLVAFLMPNSGLRAATAMVPNADNAKAFFEKMQSSEGQALAGAAMEKQHQKKGFFGKMKSFGSKVKALAKGLAGSDRDPMIGALIAFFLGGLGIHRVYMGSKPIIILWYLITFGGIFGLLPLIDFIRLLIGHGDHYDGNNSFIAAFQSGGA